MSFTQACMVADALGCSLDELAGRTEFVGSFSDERQAVMNDDYARLSDAGKGRGRRGSEGYPRIRGRASSSGGAGRSSDRSVRVQG